MINLTQYYTPGYSISLLEANINALLLVLSVLFRILFQTIYGDMTRSMGMRIRAACSHLIFKKVCANAEENIIFVEKLLEFFLLSFIFRVCHVPL